MKQDKAKILFYGNLAMLEDAGVPLVRALRQNYPAPFRKLGQSLSRQIENGAGRLSDLMSQHPVFSDIEIQLVAVGEQTGRLDHVFKALADCFQGRVSLRQTIVSGLTYPIFLYHFAAVIIPAIGLFIPPALSPQRVISQIAIASFGPYLLWFSIKLLRPLLFPAGSQSALLATEFLLRIPFVGPLIRQVNYSSFFRNYSLALEAGVGVITATTMAGATCRNQAFKNRINQVAAQMERDRCPFSQAYQAMVPRHDQSELINSLMATGEETGRSAESAGRIADICQQAVTQKAERLAKLVPTLIYLMIAGYIGWKIVSFWSALISQTTDLL
jgi:type II secretory pathway component PulF